MGDGKLIENYADINENFDKIENTTNVVNATVNNNTFTTTIACIDYMWQNSRIIILLSSGFAVAFLILLILFGLSVNKMNSMSSATEKRLNSLEASLESMNGSFESLTVVSKEAVEKANTAIEQVQQNQKDISELTSISDKGDIEVINSKNYSSAISNEHLNTLADVSTDNLYSMKQVSAKNTESKRTAHNTLGDEIKDVIYMYGAEDAHVTYYLGGKYTNLHLNVSCPDEDLITEATYPLQIYAENDENNELYSMDFGRNTAVTPIDIDVTGVEFITFRVCKYSLLYNKCGLIISDSEIR